MPKQPKPDPKKLPPNDPRSPYSLAAESRRRRLRDKDRNRFRTAVRAGAIPTSADLEPVPSTPHSGTQDGPPINPLSGSEAPANDYKDRWGVVGRTYTQPRTSENGQRAYAFQIANPLDDDPEERRTYCFKTETRANQIRQKLIAQLEASGDPVLWINRLPTGQRVFDGPGVITNRHDRY